MAIATRPKPSVHHKKASGGHHRHTKHYLKTYWPYLPLMMAVVVGLAINNFWNHQSHVLGATTSTISNQLLADTNTQRNHYHESALNLNDKLAAAAQAKANDLVTRNYWSHTTPDGKSPWSFIDKTGYQYAAAGENLAYGFSSADAAVTGWMNSAEHRANVLNGTFSQVGFGVATSQNFQNSGPTTVIVALYATPAATPTFAANSSSLTSSLALPLEATTKISHIQLFSATSWSSLAAGLVAGVALAVYVIRHGLRIKKFIREGEGYILQHKFVDSLLVAVVVLGFVLTRTAGLIH